MHLRPFVPDDPNVSKRLFDGIEIQWAIAGQDLYTYLQLANPVSGIVEERPDYSNVTNGYGLFTTRAFDRTTDHPVPGSPRRVLNSTSLDELENGQYTGNLLFCSPGSSPPFGCN